MKPFVFFDIDGTVFDSAGAMARGIGILAREHGIRLAGLPSNLASMWWNVVEEHFERYLAKEIDFPTYRLESIVSIFALLDCPIALGEAPKRLERYMQCYREQYALFDDTLPCLDALSDCRLGIITNGDGQAQREKLERTGIAARFDPVVISGEVGAAKPDARIFGEACRRAGRSPEECVYVGDRLRTDAAGARDAGFAGVWLDRAGRAGAPEGVETIRSLEEFPDCVRRIEAAMAGEEK